MLLKYILKYKKGVQKINTNRNRFLYVLVGSYLYFFSVEVFNGGIVLFNKAPGNELNSKGRLADTARTQYNHFELSHFLKLYIPWVSRRLASQMDRLLSLLHCYCWKLIKSFSVLNKVLDYCISNANTRNIENKEIFWTSLHGKLESYLRFYFNY